MAQRLPDGSIQMADGRVVYANSLIQAQDLIEILPLVIPPPAWPFVSGGGGGGGSGTPGARGADGAPGPQGPQGTNPGVQGPQGFQGSGGAGAQGAQGNQGSAGAQGFQGIVGTQGAQGFQGALNPDIYAATRVVSLVAGEGTDLTIAAAIAALPAEGGLIFVKQGTYSIAATLTLPDKNVVIRGAGDGTIIDLGANAIAAFTIPTGLAAERVYTFEDFKILGTAVANQRGWSVQEANSRGVVNISRVDTVEVQFPLQVTTGSDPVLISASDCHFQQLADNSSILVVNSPAFPVVNLAMLRVRFYRAFEDAVLGVLTQGGYFVDFTNVNISAKDSYFANGSVDCTLGALNLENCFVYNYAPASNTRIVVADDNFSAIESAVIGCNLAFVDFELAGSGTRFVGCTADTCSFKDGSVSFFGDCYFIGGPGTTPATAVITGVNDTVIDGCFFDDIGGGNFSVVSPRIVSGCAFRTSAPPIASIDLPNGNAVITGNYFESGVPIRETITANNTITGNTFAGSAPTILAPSNTRLNGVRRHDVTGGATVDALTTVFTHNNAKGLTGAGSIKNTGINDLTVRRTATDGYGTTDFQEDVVLAGATFAWPMDSAIGTALAAFVTFTVSVKSTTPGSPTTYDLRHSSAGAY